MAERVEVLNEENSIVNHAKLMGAIDKILIKKSITKRVSDVQPLKGPVGIISGAQWDKTTGTLSLAKADIEASIKKIRTEFTIESLQDLQGIYGESFYEVLAHYIVDEMAYQIDEEFIVMVKARAAIKPGLVFDSGFDKDLRAVGYSIAIKISKGLADLPISDNRAPKGWAIVSSDVASVLGLTTNVNENTELVDGEKDNSPSYIGKLNGVDYYIDYTHPNTATDAVVFGIKGNGFSKGSTIYSPYSQDWIETINPETGEPIFFLLHRSAIAINPLDDKIVANTGISGFLGKFSVDFSGLQIFN